MKTINKIMITITALLTLNGCGVEESSSELDRGFSLKKYQVVCSIGIFAPIQDNVEAKSKKTKTEEDALDLLYRTNLDALEMCRKAVGQPCINNRNVRKSSYCSLRNKGDFVRNLTVPVF